MTTLLAATWGIGLPEAAASAQEDGPLHPTTLSSVADKTRSSVSATATIIDQATGQQQEVSCVFHNATYDLEPEYQFHTLFRVSLTTTQLLQCDNPISVISGEITLHGTVHELFFHVDRDSCASDGVDSCDVLALAGGIECTLGLSCVGPWTFKHSATFTLIFGSWTKEAAGHGCTVSGPNNNILNCEGSSEPLFIAPFN